MPTTKVKPPKRIGLKLYLRLLSYIKRYFWVMGIAILGNIIYAAVDSYTIHLFKPLINSGFIGQDYHFLKMLPFTILGLFLIRGIGSFFATYGTGYVSNKLILIFRSQVFDRFLLLPASFFDKNPSGKLLSTFLYNIDQITQATGDTLTTLVRSGFTVLGLLIVMFTSSWRLTLIIFVIVPILGYSISYISKRFRKLSRRIQNAMGDVTHIAEETITGYQEVRIYGAQQHQQQQFYTQLYYNFVQQMKIILTEALSSPLIQFMGAIILSLMVYVNFRDPAHPIATPGAFMAVLGAMIAIFNPLKSLNQVNASIQKGLTATASVFKLLDTHPEVDNGTITLKRVKGDIRFDNVSFQFQKNRALVLENINIDIHAGQTVAFVGKSGSGKTTLTHLLARFYQPTKGDILIDNHPLSTLNLADLRAQIALVSQNVTLFDDTIYNNIAFGALDKTTEKTIMAAAKAAHVLDFAEQLPEGMNTKIGQNGYGLSGGQRQRVAIARAILKDAPILILDEATSALDNESEKLIQESLMILKQNRTTLVIAHRLSTIENANTIFVMSEGKIIEQGTHSQLINEKGMYAHLHVSGAF